MPWLTEMSAGTGLTSEVTGVLPHKIKIIPREEFGLYDIEMDDIKLENVTKIHIDIEPNCLPVVQIEFLSLHMDVELPHADVRMKRQKSKTRNKSNEQK